MLNSSLFPNVFTEIRRSLAVRWNGNQPPAIWKYICSDNALMTQTHTDTVRFQSYSSCTLMVEPKGLVILFDFQIYREPFSFMNYMNGYRTIWSIFINKLFFFSLSSIHIFILLADATGELRMVFFFSIKCGYVLSIRKHTTFTFIQSV